MIRANGGKTKPYVIEGDIIGHVGPSNLKAMTIIGKQMK